MTLPPPTFTPCEFCSEPTIPYGPAVEQFNMNGTGTVTEPLIGDPIHVPTFGNLFYFSCGFSR